MNYPVLGGLLAISFLVAVYKIQFLIIYPSSLVPGSRTDVDTPSSYDMKYTEETVYAKDGVSLKVFVIPSTDPAAKKTILMFGPNAGNMGLSLPIAHIIHKAGYNVVLMDYRGYGKSSGSPSEKGLKLDAEAVIRFIKLESSLANTQLYLYGRSLGGAVTIYCATNLPQDWIAGAILENTFLSINKCVPSVLPAVGFLSPLVTQTWKSEDLITKIRPEMPILFLGGGKDEIIPPNHFKKLYELCTSQKKQMCIYPEGTHNDTVVQTGYFKDLLGFLST